MNYQKKTIIQLKEICKKRKIKGYSRLNKSEIIQLLLNNKKGGVNIITVNFNNHTRNIKYINHTKFLGIFNKNNSKCDKEEKKTISFINSIQDSNLKNEINKFSIENQSIKKNFNKSKLKSLSNFERYFMYLEMNYSIFKKIKSNYNKFNWNFYHYGIIIYVKTKENRQKNRDGFYQPKKNKSKTYKTHCKILRIRQCNNYYSYVNRLVTHMNKITTKSTTKHCSLGKKLRLRLKSNLNNISTNDEISNITSNNSNNTTIESNTSSKNSSSTSSSIFSNNDIIFCIPEKNDYIEKYDFQINNKNIKIGNFVVIDKQDNFGLENWFSVSANEINSYLKKNKQSVNRISYRLNNNQININKCENNNVNENRIQFFNKINTKQYSDTYKYFYPKKIKKDNKIFEYFSNIHQSTVLIPKHINYTILNKFTNFEKYLLYVNYQYNLLKIINDIYPLILNQYHLKKIYKIGIIINKNSNKYLILKIKKCNNFFSYINNLVKKMNSLTTTKSNGYIELTIKDTKLSERNKDFTAFYHFLFNKISLKIPKNNGYIEEHELNVKNPILVNEGNFVYYDDNKEWKILDKNNSRSKYYDINNNKKIILGNRTVEL